MFVMKTPRDDEAVLQWKMRGKRSSRHQVPHEYFNEDELIAADALILLANSGGGFCNPYAVSPPKKRRQFPLPAFLATAEVQSAAADTTTPIPAAAESTTPPTPAAAESTTPPTPAAADATTPPTPAAADAATPPAPAAADATTPPTPAAADATTPPTPAAADATTPPTPAAADATTPPTPAAAEATTPPSPAAVDAMDQNSTSPVSPLPNYHNCSVCGQVFNSSQALGGHMTSHRAKTKNASVADESARRRSAAASGRLHECSDCHQKFLSGWALGGHKRKHYDGPIIARKAGKFSGTSSTTVTGDQTFTATPSTINRPLLDLDLNLPPPPED